jgi:hypothetical protein
MRLPSFDLSSNGETLAAIVIGAILATASGMLATQFEAWLRRRERERDAALLFGEVFSTLHILLGNAEASRLQGDPWGPVTIRILHGARKEIDVYDRNRERLYDLRSANLRARVHSLMVRMAMPLDGILAAAGDLAARPGDPTLAHLFAAREGAFAMLMQLAAQTPKIVADLGAVSRRSPAGGDPLASPPVRPTDEAS